MAMTDEQVEREIAELLADDDVKLAKAESRIRNRRRQYMYSLRSMKRRGAEIRSNPEYAWLVAAFEEDDGYDD